MSEFQTLRFDSSPGGTGYMVFELEMLEIHVFLYCLQCIKVQFSAIDGIT